MNDGNLNEVIQTMIHATNESRVEAEDKYNAIAEENPEFVIEVHLNNITNPQFQKSSAILLNVLLKKWFKTERSEKSNEIIYSCSQQLQDNFYNNDLDIKIRDLIGYILSNIYQFFQIHEQETDILNNLFSMLENASYETLSVSFSCLANILNKRYTISSEQFEIIRTYLITILTDPENSNQDLVMSAFKLIFALNQTNNMQEFSPFLVEAIQNFGGQLQFELLHEIVLHIRLLKGMFEALPAEIVEALCQIITNTEISSGSRIFSIQILCKVIKSSKQTFTDDIINIANMLIECISQFAEDYNPFNSIFIDNSVSSVAAVGLRKLICTFDGHTELITHVSSIIHDLIADGDVNEIAVGFTIVIVTAPQLWQFHNDSFLNELVPYASEAIKCDDTGIRCLAHQALARLFSCSGQMSEVFLQFTNYDVLAEFIQISENESEPQVLNLAISTIVNFTAAYNKSVVPYIEQLAELIRYIISCGDEFYEGALNLMAVVAQHGGERFLPYFEELFAFAKTFIENRSEESFSSVLFFSAVHFIIALFPILDQAAMEEYIAPLYSNIFDIPDDDLTEDDRFHITEMFSIMLEGVPETVSGLYNEIAQVILRMLRKPIEKVSFPFGVDQSELAYYLLRPVLDEKIYIGMKISDEIRIVTALNILAMVLEKLGFNENFEGILEDIQKILQLGISTRVNAQIVVTSVAMMKTLEPENPDFLRAAVLATVSFNFIEQPTFCARCVISLRNCYKLITKLREINIQTLQFLLSSVLIKLNFIKQHFEMKFEEEATYEIVRCFDVSKVDIEIQIHLLEAFRSILKRWPEETKAFVLEPCEGIGSSSFTDLFPLEVRLLNGRFISFNPSLEFWGYLLIYAKCGDIGEYIGIARQAIESKLSNVIHPLMKICIKMIKVLPEGFNERAAFDSFFEEALENIAGLSILWYVELPFIYKFLVLNEGIEATHIASCVHRILRTDGNKQSFFPKISEKYVEESAACLLSLLRAGLLDAADPAISTFCRNLIHTYEGPEIVSELASLFPQ